MNEITTIDHTDNPVYLGYMLQTKPEGKVRPGSTFFGYKNSDTGMGDDSFDRIFNSPYDVKTTIRYWYATKEEYESSSTTWDKTFENVTIEDGGYAKIIFFSTDDCQTASLMANSINIAPTMAGMGSSQAKGFRGYFRGGGNGKSMPKAVQQAYDFFDTLEKIDPINAKNPNTCHMVGVYGKYPDGTEFARAGEMQEWFHGNMQKDLIASQAVLGTILYWTGQYYHDYANHNIDDYFSNSITGYSNGKFVLQNGALSSGDDIWQNFEDVENRTYNSVKCGVWNCNLSACLEYQERTKYPMLAVWSNKDCSHCHLFMKQFRSNPFNDWRRTQNIILCWIVSNDSDEAEYHNNGGTKGPYIEWMYENNNTMSMFPIYRLRYYEDQQFKMKDWCYLSFTNSTYDGDKLSVGSQNAINKLKPYLSSYQDHQWKVDAITESFDDGSVPADTKTTLYKPICNQYSDFKYGLLYGNISGSRQVQDGYPLISQSLFEFGEKNNIPMSLGQTNSFGGCGVCNAYAQSVSKRFIDNRLKAKMLFLMNHNTDMDTGYVSNNADYIHQKTGYTPKSAESVVYYWNRPDGDVVSLHVNLNANPFTTTSFKGVTTGSYFSGLYEYLRDYVFTQTTTANTFEFTDDYIMECAEYCLSGIPYDTNGYYKTWPDYRIRFLDFLFKDYARDMQFENDHVLSALGGSEVYHTVEFQDYDGQTLDLQQVKHGESATPPNDPTRDGYIFSKWEPSYENVQSDLTVIAQYTVDKNGQQQQQVQIYSDLTTKTIPISEFNSTTTKHTYSDYGEHKLRISSNVTRINVYSKEE